MKIRLFFILALLAATPFLLNAGPDSTRRKEIRDWVLRVLPEDEAGRGHVSAGDTTFLDWVKRTGELPPDFDQLPSIPFLPDPLLIDEGTRNIPVTTPGQWEEKRSWMKEQLRYYILGSCPPPPDNLHSRTLSERKEGAVTLRMVELSFGPSGRAKLTVELMIPPGNGPFPVFLTQWNHREWAQIAVRRGYVGCVYAAADAKDDTEEYARIWWPEHDFSRLMRRAYGTSRAVDFLFSQPFVDKEKIALTGHSRNGKMSLMAAALDERIAAVNTSSSGTGGELPWRYCTHPYDVEDLALLTRAQPSWFHPRLRYFIGREDRLPVDQNSFMALVAPRGLMLSTAINETASNPWGIEQAFLDTRRVYRFLGDDSRLAIRSRQGKHSVSARDIEDYVDFFDYVFGRSQVKPENRLNYPYSFESWLKRNDESRMRADMPRSRENSSMQPGGFTGTSLREWEAEKEVIKSQIGWMLGERPPGVVNPGPVTLKNAGVGEDSFGSFIQRPRGSSGMKVMPVSPYHGFGDNLFGYLYYPAGGASGNGKGLPVVIYLHEFDYSKGFGNIGRDHEIQSFFESLVAQGYAVFSFDMLGCGNRIEEGTRFYERYPEWSKMGKMIEDVRGAVDALRNIEFLDKDRVYAAGYALGGTVGLLSAALDNRIAGVVSVCGVTPFFPETPGRSDVVMKTYAHLHGLLPRLGLSRPGLFSGQKDWLPFDFQQIVASVAPRPVLVIAPLWDKDNLKSDVEGCVEKAKGVYRLYGKEGNLAPVYPDDYNRFSSEMRAKALDWFSNR